MPGLKFSAKDLLATKKLKADWYVLLVETMTKDWVPSTRTPGSSNHIAEFLVDAGPFKGVPLKHYFSEKVLGTNNDKLVPFFEALAGGKDLDPTVSYNPADAIGRKVEAYIEYVSTGDFPGNKIVEFRPHGVSNAAKP